MDRIFFYPEIETMNRHDLSQLQAERLRWQLERCYNGSSFYRQRFEAAGFDPLQLKGLDDIRRLPFLSKQDLHEAQRRSPPLGDFTVAPPDQWRELHPTTGAGGTPIYTIWSENDAKVIGQLAARMLFTCGVRPGDLIHNAFSYGLWVAGLTVHYAAHLLDCCIIPIGGDSLKRQIEFLVNFRPTVIISTPSQALYLAEKLRERGIDPRDIGLKTGMFGGEPWANADPIRIRLERALGVKAFDLYGIAEIKPVMATECPFRTGLHWAEDQHLIEVVNPDTLEPCRPGETGIVVITDLTREAMPVIRFWTNDYATLTQEPCPCGRTHARSPGGIQGRRDEMVIYRGSKFYPVQVEKVIRSYPELSHEYRIILERDEVTCLDRCLVLVEAVPGHAWDLEALQSRVQNHLEDEVRAEIEVRAVKYGSLERWVGVPRRVQDLRHGDSLKSSEEATG